MPYIVGSITKTNLDMTAGIVNSGVKTTITTTETAIISVSAVEYQSVEFKIQATQGANYNSTIVRAMHDGSSAYVTEYGTINAPVSISTFSADYNSGQLRLLAYPSSSGLTTFNVIYMALNA